MVPSCTLSSMKGAPDEVYCVAVVTFKTGPSDTSITNLYLQYEQYLSSTISLYTNGFLSTTTITVHTSTHPPKTGKPCLSGLKKETICTSAKHRSPVTLLFYEDFAWEGPAPQQFLTNSINFTTLHLRSFLFRIPSANLWLILLPSSCFQSFQITQNSSISIIFLQFVANLLWTKCYHLPFTQPLFTHVNAPRNSLYIFMQGYLLHF